MNINNMRVLGGHCFYCHKNYEGDFSKHGCTDETGEVSKCEDSCGNKNSQLNPKNMNKENTMEWEERFEKEFPFDEDLHDYYRLTGHIAKEGELKSFIKSELERRENEVKKEVIEGIIEEVEDGELRDTFEEIFYKDPEATEGIRPSMSNRSGALLYYAMIHNYLKSLVDNSVEKPLMSVDKMELFRIADDIIEAEKEEKNILLDNKEK